MLTFQIPNLSCGHCVRAVTAAIQALDPQAQVQADLGKREVQVQTTATRDAVVTALAEADYPPAP